MRNDWESAYSIDRDYGRTNEWTNERTNKRNRVKETAEAFESYLNWGELNQPKKVVHSVEFAGNLVKVWL